MEWAALVAWVVVAGALAAAGAPLAAAVFARLPGGGGAYALHVSLVVIGLASFWVGHLRYGWVALAAALAALAALSAGAYHRGHRPDWPRVAEGYLVFLAGFALAVAVRVTDNTIHPAGGEQFLHFGLLRAVGRADRLPPEDMWFAGEPVNYYYGGHVLVDLLSRLTMTEPRLAYNLGFAVVFGLAAAAAFGLVGGVVAAYGHRRRVGGAVGAAVLLLAGTLVTPVRLVGAHLPEPVAARYLAFAYAGIPSGEPLEAVIAGYRDVGGWSWWFERRVIDGTLVEVPLYSMVKADLHGHVTTIPFTVLVIAVAFAYHRTPAEERGRRLALVGLVLPAMAGLLGWMNTWSLPGAVGIAWLALAFAPAHPLSLLGGRFVRDVDGGAGRAWARSEASRLVAATVGAVGVGLIAAAWIAPFLLFQLPTNEGIGVLPDRSPFNRHVLLFGGFFALFALFLGVALWRRRGVAWPPRLVGWTVLVTVAGSVVLLAAGLGSLAIALPLLGLAWWLVRREPSVGFIGVLIVGGLGLILAMELVYADVWPPEEQRLNTTYKVSMQAMVFCLLATGAIVTVLLEERLGALGGRLSASGLATVVVVVAVVALLGVFPVMTLGGELGGFAQAYPDVDPSVDALAGHERWSPLEMEAIAWLDDRPGDPVIVEAPGEREYTWVSPASTFTGTPAVVGWAHQQGYRGVDAYLERQGHVDEIYTADADRAAALLAAYGVDYVWVGPPERDRYRGDLRDFMGMDATSVAFQNGQVTVYAVDHDRLDGAPGAVDTPLAPLGEAPMG